MGRSGVCRMLDVGFENEEEAGHLRVISSKSFAEQRAHPEWVEGRMWRGDTGY